MTMMLNIFTHIYGAFVYLLLQSVIPRYFIKGNKKDLYKKVQVSFIHNSEKST
jgi:hypothetical protein